MINKKKGLKKMNTEHVFTIGVSVDDEAIKKSVIESATRNLEKDLTDCYFYKPSYGRKEPSDILNEIVAEKIEKVIDDNKDLILDAVMSKLTEKLFRSKMVKDRISEL